MANKTKQKASCKISKDQTRKVVANSMSNEAEIELAKLKHFYANEVHEK